ncbi:uncharacterized protein LOC119742766 [Patiria miniata]|uniref:Uncharacterized protein n=1 Tax=Patiria miniata TaxID=46514 RepID=A0A914BG66_PATMI|nr:uncharacterized protein LOC119742766 [Patiria miniata]
MPTAVAEQWRRWLLELLMIERIGVSRCVKPVCGDAIVEAQLHHFADASAYTLLIPDGLKTKLAPIKTATIPRLELAAAVVAVKLDKMIKLHMQIPFAESVFWSDSMIVLQYLRNEDKQFQTFAMIHNSSSPTQWRHVDSASNPADNISRGMTAQ